MIKPKPIKTTNQSVVQNSGYNLNVFCFITASTRIIDWMATRGETTCVAIQLMQPSVMICVRNVSGIMILIFSNPGTMRHAVETEPRHSTIDLSLGSCPVF